ncbi:MAG: transglutaminase family protein [Desulfurococcaceae archaeon TW002]
MLQSLNSRARTYFLLTLLLALILFSSWSLHTALVISYAQESPSYDILNFLYVDVAVITYVSNVSEGYFEVPINYTEPHYTQVVQVSKIGGDVIIDSSKNNTVFKIPINNNTRGFVVLNVTLIRESRRELNIMVQALYLGNIYLYDHPYPEEIVQKYVLQPNEKVVEIVVPLFEEWMRSRFSSINLSRVSKTFLAIWAAKYIYEDHLIKYNASSIPRSLDEVLEKREGDCDDKSRILLSMLWHYGVPAKIQYGYVYLKFDYVADVYGSLTRFINAGPHAYVVIYVPTVGWVSVDFLAWARLHHPALITGESTYSSVTNEDLEEVKKFYTSFKYLELIEVHESSKLPDDLIRDLENNDLIGRLERMLLSESQETNTTTTTIEPSTTYSPITQTTNTHYEETEKTEVTVLEASLETFIIIALVVSAAILLLVVLKVRQVF